MTYKQEWLAVVKKEIRRLRKLVKLVPILILTVPSVQAQTIITETLGAGTPSTTCQYQGSCIAPVLEADGTPNGTVEIHASVGVLHRYAIDGTKLWDSTDFVQSTGNFTHDGVPGNLAYTMAGKSVRCGGSGRWFYTCVYRWISSGTLTE